MLLQMALFRSFIWLSNIPLHICTTSLSIHLTHALSLNCCIFSLLTIHLYQLSFRLFQFELLQHLSHDLFYCLPDGLLSRSSAHFTLSGKWDIASPLTHSHLPPVGSLRSFRHIPNTAPGEYDLLPHHCSHLPVKWGHVLLSLLVHSPNTCWGALKPDSAFP